MRAMINNSVCEVVKAYKREHMDGKSVLILEVAAGMKYSIPMNEADIALALNQLHDTGRLIGNWKI